MAKQIDQNKLCSESTVQNGFAVISSIYVALMISVYLFCFDSTGYIKIMEVKRTVFYTICGGYCVVILLFGIQSSIVGQYKFSSLLETLRPTSWTQRFFLMYWLFTMLSAIFSTNAGTFLGNERSEGLLTIGIYFLCFYFISKFFVYKKWMLWFFSVSITVFCAICAMQLQGINLFGLYPQGYTYFDKNLKYAGEFIGTIGNVDFTAAFLCLAVPLLWISIIKLSGRRRLLLLIPLILSLYTVTAIHVMAGYLGVALSIIFTLPLLFNKRKNQQLAVATVLLCCIAAAVYLYCVDIGNGFLHEMHQLLHGNFDDSAGSGRIYIWKNVLERIPDRLFFGHGPDTMCFSDIKPFSRYDPAIGKTLYAYVDAAHNEILNILFSQGLFAAISYICATFSLLIRGIREANKSAITLAFTAAVLGYYIQAFFGISQLISAPYFWLAMGILEKAQGGERKTKELHMLNESIKKGTKK